MEERMESETTAKSSSGNKGLLIAGGILGLLCLCGICIVAGFFVIRSNTVPGLIFSGAQPSPVPTFVMPTIPPVATLDINPTEASDPIQPTAVSNVRMAYDEDGVKLSTTFSAFDTVYVVGDLSGAVTGDSVTSSWYAEDVIDVDKNFFIDKSTLEIGADPVDIFYFFFEPPTDGWPLGTYRVEIYFNDALADSLNFVIE
jgi:hypothetical protein